MSGMEKSRAGQLEVHSRGIERERRGDGEYVFERLPRGFTYVVATATGFVSDWDHFWIPRSDVLELELDKGVVISGTVRSTRGEPVPGATVRDDRGDSSVMTDDEGRFLLGGFDGAGYCYIQASAAGFADAYQEVNLRDVDLVLPREAVLSGRVLAAATGLPLAGATVSIQQQHSVVTDVERGIPPERAFEGVARDPRPPPAACPPPRRDVGRRGRRPRDRARAQTRARAHGQRPRALGNDISSGAGRRPMRVFERRSPSQGPAAMAPASSC